MTTENPTVPEDDDQEVRIQKLKQRAEDICGR
jgi:hypothetical protein